LRLLLPVFILSLLASTAHAATELPASGEIGQDWTLTTPDGIEVNLQNEVDQQATVLFFWASWCPYCKALMPHLQSMRFEYGDQVKILAINIFEDSDPVAVIAKGGYDFTLLLEGDMEAGEYGITGTPGVIILDKDRVVRFDLRTLVRIPTPKSADAANHSQKAALRAPYWAAEIRASLDALIADTYSSNTGD